MKTSLTKVKAEIEQMALDTGRTELEIIDKLKDHYFNKKVTANLKLYKKGKKKVSDITKDLKISPRKFYAILEKKNIQHKKYNKTTEVQAEAQN